MVICPSMALSMALSQLKLHSTLVSKNSVIALYHLTLSYLKLDPPSLLQNPDLEIGQHSVPGSCGELTDAVAQVLAVGRGF